MKNTFIKIVCTTLIFIIIFAPLRFDFFYIHKYANAWYGDDLYITEDVIWNSDTDLSEYSVVYITDGATVTVEVGSHMDIKSVVVQDAGRIIAVGSIDNKIVFTKMSFDNSHEFDEQCFVGAPSFEFDVYEINGYVFEPSFFKFVEFNGLGENFDYNALHCPGIVMQDTIINTAYAEDEPEYVEDIQTAPAILHSSGQLDMENVIFKNSEYIDIQVEMELEGGYNENSYVHIKNSNFEGNEQNVAVISDVTIYDYEAEDACYDNCDDEYDDNQNDAIYDVCCELCESSAITHDDSKVVLTNNWYGHVNGPTGSFVNENGDDYEILLAGEKISGNTNVLENDWRKSSDFASNVLFLPGAKASKLHDQSNQVWPPTPGGDDYRNLLLDEDGNSIEDIHTDDPIDEAGLPGPLGTNIYKSFIGDLERLKSDKIVKDISLYAYDWRQSVEDIVKNGTQYPNGENKNPIEELERLADSSVSGKVTIVAHSNGGLLAKAIMQRLEILNMTDKVDNIIMVSSPQMGTPKAILTMLYGYDEKLPLPGLITNEEARQIVENMPGAYGLLPTQEYFNRAEYDIIDFESENTKYKKYKDAYGNHINDYDEFKDFLLAKKDNRQKPDKDDVDNANILNEKLFDENIELQEELNNWTPPENVNVIQIGGWGLDTIKGIEYREKLREDCTMDMFGTPICTTFNDFVTVLKPKYTVDGDEVVVTPSSLALVESENVERYFVDLFGYNKSDFWLSTNKEHKNILEINQLRSFISGIIKKHEILGDLPKYILDNKPDNIDSVIEGSKHNATRIRMALYSPLDVHLYDNQGNHTGPTTDENGNKTLEINIPNSYYDVFSEHKFVGWGGGSDVRVELAGYDTGSYTIKLEEISITDAGEKIDSHLTMKNLPTGENTKVTFAIPDTGLENITKLTADYDGDGINDYEIVPQINEEVTLNYKNNDNVESDDNDNDENSEDDNDGEEKNDIIENISNNESLRGGTTKQSLGDDALNILIGILFLLLIITSVFIFKKLIK